MELPTKLRDLSEDEWNRLQDLADRFEEEWKESDDVDLAAFLPGAGDSLRVLALHELIKSDLEIRWRKQRGKLLEQYLRECPDLGQSGDVSPELVYEEYRVRQLFGDRPALPSYQARFPSQFEALQALVRKQPIPDAGSAKRLASATPPAQEGMNDTQARPERTTVKPAPPETTGGSGSPASEEVGEGYRKTGVRIGGGGFGEVWLGIAPGGIKVALKVLFRPMEDDEARRELGSLNLIKELRHPFLLQTQAFWVRDGRLHIAMELAERSLRDRVRQCRQEGRHGVPIDELVRYFREAAEALDYLHSENVLHRDIKPDNILLMKSHAKLGDFGLARLLQPGHTSVSGSGTPAYMAPEVWGGKAGPASDQYSLALTYAELRLQRRIFSSQDLPGLMHEQLLGTPDLEGMLSEERQIVARALSKDPKHRFDSCLEFVRRLHQAVLAAAGSPTLSSQTMPLRRAGDDRSRTGVPMADATERLPLTDRGKPPRSHRKLLLLAIVAVLLVGLPIGGYIAFRPPTEHSNSSGSIPPDEGAYTLPDRCQAVPGTEMVTDLSGHALPRRIELVLDDQSRVHLILIPRKAAADSQSFFVMEDKVTNALYAKFAADHPDVVQNSQWQLGGQAGKDNAGNKDDLPVLRITAEEARRFANWLGGALPTIEQWDRAAGCRAQEGRPGPYMGTWNGQPTASLGVGRRQHGPLPVQRDSDDVSPLEVRGLAGNGREFTRNLLDGTLSPPTEARDDTLVILRGRSYTSPAPLTYADLDYEQKTPQTQYYLHASPFTGFRVVLELR